MSRLENISLSFRKTNLARNSYNPNDPYNVSHDRALSTGDEWGKGERNGEVGGATDIKVRKILAAKNKFNRNIEYNDATA